MQHAKATQSLCQCGFLLDGVCLFVIGMDPCAWLYIPYGIRSVNIDVTVVRCRGASASMCHAWQLGCPLLE